MLIPQMQILRAAVMLFQSPIWPKRSSSGQLLRHQTVSDHGLPMNEASPTTFELTAASRAFWPQFVVPAVALPAIWALLHGLAGSDGIIAFYVVSIGALPLAFFLILIPGKRLLDTHGTQARKRAPLVMLLMLPSVGVFLWGIFCVFWLVLLLLRGEF
jgi:hypothetical protein